MALQALVAAVLVVGRVGGQQRAGLEEVDGHRQALVHRHEVAEEQRDVFLRHAAAEGGEAVVVAQAVGVLPLQAHQPGAGDGVVKGFGRVVARQQPQQLALVAVAPGLQAGERVELFGDQQLPQCARTRQVAQRIGLGLARAGDQRHHVDHGAAGAQRRVGVAPGVHAQPVDQRVEALAPCGRKKALAAREEHRIVFGGRHAGPHQQILVVEAERCLPGHHFEREPCAGLVAFVQVVVHEPGLPSEGHALARGGQAGLGHHAVLVVGQFVGRGREQVDQHLVVVGLAGALPARHAFGHGGHERVAEGVVVAREVVDLRAGRKRRAVLRRRAVVGEAAGAELEADGGEERVDAAAVPHQVERVGRVVAHRRHAQRKPLGIRPRHRGDLDLPGRRAGRHARAAPHAKDLPRAGGRGRYLGQDRGHVQFVEEAQVEVRMVGVRTRLQRHQHELHAVEVLACEHVGAVVDQFLEHEFAHGNTFVLRTAVRACLGRPGAALMTRPSGT